MQIKDNVGPALIRKSIAEGLKNSGSANFKFERIFDLSIGIVSFGVKSKMKGIIKNLNLFSKVECKDLNVISV